MTSPNDQLGLDEGHYCDLCRHVQPFHGPTCPTQQPPPTPVPVAGEPNCKCGDHVTWHALRPNGDTPCQSCDHCAKFVLAPPEAVAGEDETAARWKRVDEALDRIEVAARAANARAEEAEAALARAGDRIMELETLRSNAELQYDDYEHAIAKAEAKVSRLEDYLRFIERIATTDSARAPGGIRDVARRALAPVSGEPE